MNLAWAGGQIIGSASAKAVGDGLPTATSAGLCVLTLLALSRRRSEGDALGLVAAADHDVGHHRGRE
jgi:hypothetical protein